MAKPLRFQHFEVLTRPDGSPHLLGKGAMGLTYKAFDRNLLSLVVVKVIAPELMNRPEARQRFLQEAQSMAKIKHPNVADVFFLGDSPQGVFYAMEFCDGPSMQEYVEERGPMDPGDVLALGLQTAHALEAVEKNNLIHRDIKPSNLILVNDAQGRSQIKLIDFGLARDILRDSRDPSTSQGSFVGTPTFASPEQLLEQEGLDIRSDIYSLGITLWFMLSGRAPFGGSQFEVMFHHVNTPPPWDRLPVMPAASLAVLRRMIEKSPDERFQDSGALARELERVIEAEGFGGPGTARLQLGTREITGSVLGMSSFEILAEADSDLTGKIFRARDAHSAQVVALKYLHPEIVAKPTLLGKIQRQVLSLRTLEHPNLVGVLGFEKSEDGAKIILEWVRGPSLLALLKARNQLNLREAAPVLAQLASALDFSAARGLGTVETDLHQIILTSPDWGEDPAGWPKSLRQPVETWKNVRLKVNPLRLSLAPQDYPSVGPSGQPDASAGGPKPLLGAFLQLAHRLLGGAGSSQSSAPGGFVSIPGLGAEANDLLESFAAPPFTQEKREATCASVLTGLCEAEGVPVPEIYEPPPEPEEDLLATRDASLGTIAPPSQSASTAGQIAPVSTSGRFGTQSSAGIERPGSSVRFGTQRPGTRFGSTSGSSAGRISVDYEIKRKELELQRQRLEAEAERLKQEEVLEATRAMLDEERAALAEAKDEFARQERDRAQRAEQERRKLEEERTRLEAKTNEVDVKRREQERLEQEIRLRAQLEFQKFEDERRQREADWARQREEIERSLKEREEQSFVREQQSFKKLREERERLQKLQLELEEGKAQSQLEAEAALRQQVAELEAERRALADEQAELDRRLLAQNQEFAGLREQFDAAEREIETRHQRLAAEETASAARREQENEAERRRLADERAQLEEQRAALAAEREAGTAATAGAIEARAENEAALARLAAEEARVAAQRASLEAEHSQRESALAAELVQAKRELEAERAALAQEAERARTAGSTELENERAAIAATRAQLAAQESVLLAQLEDKARALETQLASQRAEIESERSALATQRERLDAEHLRLANEFAREKEAFGSELDERRRTEEEAHRLRMQERAEELARLEREQQGRLTALRTEIAVEEARLQQQKEEVFTQERLITRMDQEASYQDEETLDELESEHQRLETQRGEIEQKLTELHRAQKKRLVTLVVGTILGLTAVSAVGRHWWGRLYDPGKLKWDEAWARFETERKATVETQDWPALLNWCVQTNERFRDEELEPDPAIRDSYKDKRGVVLDDARKAIDGLLGNLESGWQPPPPEDEAFKKLRQNLGVVAGSDWDGLPNERFLVLAKLDLPYLTAEQNPVAALETYSSTVKRDPTFVGRLEKELTVTVQGLLDDFLEDHALDKRNAISEQLRNLQREARDNVPRTWLLLYLLKIEDALSGKPTVQNFTIALDAINFPVVSDETKKSFAADPFWEQSLRREVDRVLEAIKVHPETILKLEEPLRTTAEQWKVDTPYMMLAGIESLETQKKLDFYLAAEKLTGSPEAGTRVAGYYLRQADTLRQEGKLAAANTRIKEAMPRLEKAAAAGVAEAMSLLSDVLRLGQHGGKDVDKAIVWATKAREKGHPDADYSLGLCYLEKAEESKDSALLAQAEAAFRSATQSPGSLNAPHAWYFLAHTYSMIEEAATKAGDEPGAAAARTKLIVTLEKGAQFNDLDSLHMLGMCQYLGKYFKTANRTLGRDNITKAARGGHTRARAWLKEEAKEWEKSTVPADREWVRKNRDLTTE